MNIVCLKTKLISVHLLSKPAHDLPYKTHSYLVIIDSLIATGINCGRFSIVSIDIIQ
jgi:hypothetical protein